jgi:hypothetical protein
VHRRGVRTAVRVHDEEVHGVRADVQHPESHGAILPGRQTAPLVATVIRGIERTTSSSSWSAEALVGGGAGGGHGSLSADLG